MGNSQTDLKDQFEKQPRKIVLLGDSTIDNGNWTNGGPALIEQVREFNPSAQLLARDGALIAAVLSQSNHIPPDATHVVISVGGNNGLSSTPLLKQGSSSVELSLVAIFDIITAFEHEYSAMVAAVLAAHPAKHFILCGCYNPCFGPWVVNLDQRAINMVVALLADLVLRVAARHGLPVIDLRRVMREMEDFANPIEPASPGGAKMASAIAHVVLSHPFQEKTTIVYPPVLDVGADVLSSFVQLHPPQHPDAAAQPETSSSSTPPQPQFFAGGDEFRGNNQ